MRSILILEENRINFRLCSDLLEAHGHHVDGDRHLIPVMRRVLKTKPDLIVTGILLPELSGLSFIRWIRTTPHLANLRVLVVTAFAMKGDKEKIESYGPDYYMAKPISPAHFLEIVDKLLDPNHPEIGPTTTRRAVSECSPPLGLECGDPLEELNEYLRRHPGTLEPDGLPPESPARWWELSS